MSGGPTWTEAEDDLLRGMSPRSYYAMVAGTDRERGFPAIKARKTTLNQIGATKKPDRPQTARPPAVEATGGIDRDDTANDVQSPVQFSSVADWLAR